MRQPRPLEKGMSALRRPEAYASTSPDDLLLYLATEGRSRMVSPLRERLTCYLRLLGEFGTCPISPNRRPQTGAGGDLYLVWH